MSEKRILCAVYGSLKRGFGNHNRHLAHAKLLGKTKTNPEYTMYDLGAFPGIKKNGNTGIEIEVYEVTKEEDLGIEYLEGYIKGNEDNNFYNKVFIDTEFGKASIYLINRETEHLNKFDGGVWNKK